MRILCAIAALCLMTSPVLAQMQRCAPYVAFEAALKERHQSQLLIGQGSAGVRMELWTAPNNGRWTILLRRGNIACVHGGGPTWSPVEQSKDEGQGS